MPVGQAKAARREGLVVLHTFRSVAHGHWADIGLVWDSRLNAGAVGKSAGSIHCKYDVLADLRSSSARARNSVGHRLTGAARHRYQPKWFSLVGGLRGCQVPVSSSGYVGMSVSEQQEPAVCMRFRFLMNYTSLVIGGSLDLSCCPKAMS